MPLTEVPPTELVSVEKHTERKRHIDRKSIYHFRRFRESRKELNSKYDSFRAYLVRILKGLTIYDC